MRKFVLMFAAITMLLACNSENNLTKQCEKQLDSKYEALRDNDPVSFFKTESKYYALIAEIEENGCIQVLPEDILKVWRCMAKPMPK